MAGSVAVGAGTRAYREGGPGLLQRTAAGSVAVGSQTRAARLGGYPTPAAAPPAAHPFVQPPIPTAAYNPIRSIELAAGKRGEQNTVEDLGTREGRGQANYLLGTEGVNRQEAEQGQDQATALATLQRSYQRLGVRQAEQGNAAGTLYGGAAQASANARAANEGIQTTALDTAYQRQQEADQRSLGQLTLGRQQEAEDNQTGVTRAEREQGQFGIDTRTLEAREASENGYVSPTPPVPGLLRRTAAGTVAVGSKTRAARLARRGR